MVLDLQSLAKDVRDIIEMRESLEPTFGNFITEDYTEWFWDMLRQRADPGVEHSVLVSITGLQGCHAEGTLITTRNGLVPIEKIVAGDEVWTRGGWRQCVPIKKGKMECVEVELKRKQKIMLTPDHVMLTSGGWKRIDSVAIGDSLVSGNVEWKRSWTKDSERAALVAMVLADGTLQRPLVKKGKEWRHSFVRFTKGDESLLKLFKEWSMKYAGARVSPADCLVEKSSKLASEEGRKTVRSCTVNKKSVFDWFVSRGVPIGDKSRKVEIPTWVMKSDATMNGFLAGYFACDGHFTGKSIGITTSSELLRDQLVAFLGSRGLDVRLTCVRTSVGEVHTVHVSGKGSIEKWMARVPNLSTKKMVASPIFSSNEREALSKKRISRQLDVVKVTSCGVRDVYDLHVKDVHEYLANGLISHNSGKSLSSLSMCCFMDPEFSIDKVFFRYDDLIYNRASIKPNSAVLVDEQSQAYGLDSHRIMIILAQMKEQLRKKSIHFFFCAPTLYEESKTSMYILETMFIDRQTMEVYAALKTREGLTLGHVRIPHPLKPLADGRSLASPVMIEAYQKKKDEHLENVLGQKNVDPFEDRAMKVSESELFKRAERLYKVKYGYIPQGTIIQIVNKLYPEYQGGVVSGEIASRVKFNKELSGEWDMPGRSSKKQDQEKKRRK